jgi:uncharacterized membrane protein
MTFRQVLPSALVAVILAGATVCAAQEPPGHQWPDPGLSYRVAGVAANDTLVVREQPDHRSAALERWPHDAEGIIVTGVRIAVGGGWWWRVVGADGRGWVNGRYLEVEDATIPGEDGYPLACVGTEPFWSLRVGDGEAVFEEAGGETSERFRAGPWLPFPGRYGFVAIRLGDEPASGMLTGRRSPEGCSDGMSGYEHPIAAVLVRPDGTGFEGCCERAG